MKHSIVEAKNNLSALVDRALAGEEVTITRHGRPVVRLVPAEDPARSGHDLLALVDRLRVVPEQPLDFSPSEDLTRARERGDW